MILVIMGAGASYDSIPSKPTGGSFSDRPPLANNLFDEEYLTRGSIQNFGRCTAIIPHLQNRPDGKSLEQKLQEYQEQANSYPERLKQLAGLRFYLQNMLSNIDLPWYNSGLTITNHLALIDQIKENVKDKVCFVTFNYDRLIEFTLAKHRIKFSSMDDYISTNDFLLFKLHGSVNWKRRIIQYPAGISDVAEVIENADSLHFSNELAIINNPLIVKVNDHLFYPALSIPVLTKSQFECPIEHLHKLKSLLPETKLIIIVGWRGAETNFVNILREYIHNGTPTMIVAGSEADARYTFKNIRSSGLSLPFNMSDKGFTKTILAKEISDFVKDQYDTTRSLG